MTININKKHVITGCLLLGTLLMFGCNAILPEDFNEDTSLDMPAIDQQACTMLTSDEGPTPVAVTVFDGGLDNQALDSLWINAGDALIGTLYDTLLMDTHIQIRNILYADTSYAMFIPSTSGDIYFYITWDFNQDNIKTYVDFNLIDKSGTPLTVQDYTISQKTVAGSTQAVDIGGEINNLPTIRSRKMYTLNAGEPYLIEFVVPQPLDVGFFRMVILL